MLSFQLLNGNSLFVIDNTAVYALTSIFLSIGIFLTIKFVIQSKLGSLQGSYNLLGLISVTIAGGEIIYLGAVYGLFQFAIEFIAYLGIGLWILLIPFQNHLKNITAGIGNYLNSDYDIGDIIEVKGQKGMIIEFHLTKTILLNDDGHRINVPNYRFHEDVLVISKKQRKQNNTSLLKYIN